MINCYKGSQNYYSGLRILCHSANLEKEKGTGWHRIGTQISYYKNLYYFKYAKDEKSFYTLSFTHEFEYDHDEVYFSSNYPYTYTDLSNYI